TGAYTQYCSTSSTMVLPPQSAQRRLRQANGHCVGPITGRNATKGGKGTLVDSIVPTDLVHIRGAPQPCRQGGGRRWRRRPSLASARNRRPTPRLGRSRAE